MRGRSFANRLLQNYSEATTACIFHAVIKEVELPAGTAIAVFRSPLPFEFVLASGGHGIKSADTHIGPRRAFCSDAVMLAILVCGDKPASAHNIVSL
jgi:hypothetical protein